MSDNKYQKSVYHKTDKWGNLISNKKTSYIKNTVPPINNPFKDFFKDIKFDDCDLFNDPNDNKGNK